MTEKAFVIPIGKNLDVAMQEVGGKSYHLNKLKYHNFPVPNGVIITNDYFTKENTMDFTEFLEEHKRYAVRSSALDEDGNEYSFAGLQDTYLNVSIHEIEEKVNACYQSQFNQRAKEYRKKFNIDASRGMTVIIQEMVEATFSGVVFSQNPMNNRMDQCVIEVVKGLGEGLVSGHKTPTTYILDKKDHTVLNVKENDSSLKQDLRKRVLKYVLSIEKLYGKPQDIEFAIKDDKIFILQARPITTTVVVPETRREGLRFFLSFGHIQNMTDPMTPVGAEMIQSILNVPGMDFFKDRVLFNGAFLYVDISELLLTPNFIYKKVKKIIANINYELPELAELYRKENKTRQWPDLNLLKVQIILFMGIIHVFMFKKLDNKHLLDYFKEHYKRFKSLNKDELIHKRSKVLLPMFKVVLPSIFSGVISYVKLKKLFEKWDLSLDDYQKIISGIEGNITSEMGLLYDDILLNYGTALGEEYFQKYIRQFGMRTDGEIDIGRERPKDDIDAFREKIKKQAVHHNGESLRRKRKHQIKTSKETLSVLKESLSKYKYKKIKRLVDYISTYYILREHPKHTIMKIFDLYRQHIKTPYKTLPEQDKDSINNDIVKERKVRYLNKESKNIPLAMLSNGLILRTSNKSEEGVIKGFGVSSGKITGKVRVIKNIDDDILREGEILVTRFTDPGWTPMMSKAGAIITEVGGMMTHGAIVSREYGIPAVVSVHDAVNIFKTGDLITLDGDSGVIIIESSEESENS